MQHTHAGAPLQDAAEERVKEMNRRLMQQKNLPEFEPVPLSLASLVSEGMRLVAEQELVNTTKLGEEYMVRGGVWVLVGGHSMTHHNITMEH